ncbi:MAG: hypothetical protein ABL906_00320 [Sideroxydans sp.]
MRRLLASLFLMSACCANAHAEGLPPLTWTEVQPQNQLWVNAGFYSFHFDPSLGLNNANYGLGMEYRYSSTSSLTVGQFYNSDRVTSHYAGMYWEPVTWGKVKLGAVIGGFDGYPHMLNGGWFPAVIPVASVEFDRVGANIAFVPTLQNRLYGAVSVQLKVRLY